MTDRDNVLLSPWEQYDKVFDFLLFFFLSFFSFFSLFQF